MPVIPHAFSARYPPITQELKTRPPFTLLNDNGHATAPASLVPSS